VRLLDGNGALRELDDRFRAVLLLLLLCKLPIDIPDVLGGSILSSALPADAIRKALLAFMISNPFRTFPLTASSLPPMCAVSW
jgi:hypothetical protein